MTYAASATPMRWCVRYTGLDITVYSSGSKRAPGHLRLAEAAMANACRSIPPDYD